MRLHMMKNDKAHILLNTVRRRPIRSVRLPQKNSPKIKPICQLAWKAGTILARSHNKLNSVTYVRSIVKSQLVVVDWLHGMMTAVPLTHSCSGIWPQNTCITHKQYRLTHGVPRANTVRRWNGPWPPTSSSAFSIVCVDASSSCSTLFPTLSSRVPLAVALTAKFSNDFIILFVSIETIRFWPRGTLQNFSKRVCLIKYKISFVLASRFTLLKLKL